MKCDPVDGVSNDELFMSFTAHDTSVLLQQSHDQSSSVVVIALVSVNHRDPVLRISPECVCQSIN